MIPVELLIVLFILMYAVGLFWAGSSIQSSLLDTGTPHIGVLFIALLIVLAWPLSGIVIAIGGFISKLRGKS